MNFFKWLCCGRTNGQSCFCDGSRKEVSASTRRKVAAFLEDDYIKGLHTSVPRLVNLLVTIPEDEDIFQVNYDNGFNLLQKCVAENNFEAVRMLLRRDPDLNLNSYPCSFPLHIACLKGYLDVADLLVTFGAQLDIKGRMCWPGPHLKGCPGIKNESRAFRRGTTSQERSVVEQEGRDALKNALLYTIDGNQPALLDHLLYVQKEKAQTPLELTSLLEAACSSGAWSCCSILMKHIGYIQLFKDLRIEPLLPPVKSEMTFLHFLFNKFGQTVDFALRACRVLRDYGLALFVNTLDSVGNSPLHSLIIRYSFEQSRRRWHSEDQPWDQASIQEMVELFLKCGGVVAVNQPGNSGLSNLVYHVNDWEFIHVLLTIMLDAGGDPHLTDRQGHCPLAVCLIRLTSERLFEVMDPYAKLSYYRCLQALCDAGADPNVQVKPPYTTLHGLIFTLSKTFSCKTEYEMADNFEFILYIIRFFFLKGLDAKEATATPEMNVYRGVLQLIELSDLSKELEKIYELIVTLMANGVDPNAKVIFLGSGKNPDNPFYTGEENYFLAHLFVVFANKKNLLENSSDACLSILYLVHGSMDHDSLMECLSIIYTHLPAAPSDRAERVLYDALRRMCTKPRELKYSARVFVNRTFLDRSPDLYARKLPISELDRAFLKYHYP